jgi:hypothetical protein
MRFIEQGGNIMATTAQGQKAALTTEKSRAGHMDRAMWDRMVSATGAVLAVVLIALGGAAIFGGMFGQDNVQDRLVPQKITFPPAEAMTPAETAEVGDFAGAYVDTGSEAEAFARYIGLHLEEVNEGKTYSETSAAARAEGIPEDEAAELQGKADTLFKGEALRGNLLNAYGWWTVSTIALYAGFGLAAAGLILAVFAFLGFRHAKKSSQDA